ncbi:signal peptidase II [Jatrophihabitans sp. DSM 45814]
MSHDDPTSAADPAADVVGASDAGHQRPRRIGLLAAVAGTALLLDIITKALVVAHLRPGDSPRFLGGVIYFSLIKNSGAAFGMASGMTAVFALVAVGVVVAIIRITPRLRSVPWAVGIGLVLGGAVGNLLDRLFRAPGALRGSVIDFISVFGPDAEHFPAFNIADSAITVGAVVIGLTAVLGIGLDGHRNP